MLFWPEELIEHLDRITKEATQALAVEVPRAAVVRAAITAWLTNVQQRPPNQMLQEIEAATRRSAIPLRRRHPTRWPDEMSAQLAQLATLAARELGCQVPPGAVVRAAVRGWLADLALRSPDVVMKEVRAAMVKRGRKAKSRAR